MNRSICREDLINGVAAARAAWTMAGVSLADDEIDTVGIKSSLELRWLTWPKSSPQIDSSVASLRLRELCVN